MNDRDLKLGVIGVGHWFERLNEGIKKKGGISLEKAVGTKSFNDKVDLLSRFGITRDRYYTIEKDGNIPNSFFNDLDIVHIADPNKFHTEQTLHSLNRNKITIVEKSFGTNREDFDRVISFIKKNGLFSIAYLHLHYIHKQPTIKLIQMLPQLVEKYGKIDKIYATFFEKINQEDSKRKWVYSLENGGLFMDWIHPFEVISYATAASFQKIRELDTYIVNRDYDLNNPTGIRVDLGIDGELFSNDAHMVARLGKGVGDGFENKYLKICFESGEDLMIGYEGSEREFESNNRGYIELRNGKKVIMGENLSGPNSSEIFVDEIMDLVKGTPQDPGIDLLEKIFKPQWDYQSLVSSRELIDNETKVNQFLNNES